MTLGGNQASLKEIISPYLEIAGVFSVALATTEGLLVSVAGENGVRMEAVAALAAGSLTNIAALAAELGDHLRIMGFDFHRQGLIIAPLTREVFLILLGSEDILELIKPSGF